jgi:hypothetical protein
MRPDARGLLSIGLLVVAFSTGGKSSDFLQEQYLNLTLETPIEAPRAHEGDPAVVEEVLVPVGPQVAGIVTHYGAQYNGHTLGCGTGYYSSDNVSIIAVGPSRNSLWPCGTMIEVCGPAGCIMTVRHDGCPGCGPNHADLSEAGIAAVCGYGPSQCEVRFQAFLRVVPPEPPHHGETH